MQMSGQFWGLYNLQLYARQGEWAVQVARIREKINTYRVLVGNSERKRPSGRPRLGWKVNIKIDLKEIVRDVVDWIHVIEDMDKRLLSIL